MPTRLFTSESVTEGHPDKIADAISDAVLDAMLTEDSHSHAAVETVVTTGQVMVCGGHYRGLCRHRRHRPLPHS